MANNTNRERRRKELAQREVEMMCWRYKNGECGECVSRQATEDEAKEIIHRVKRKECNKDKR